MRSSRFGVLAAAGAVGLVLVTSSVQSIATASPFGSLDAGSSFRFDRDTDRQRRRLHVQDALHSRPAHRRLSGARRRDTPPCTRKVLRAMVPEHCRA